MKRIHIDIVSDVSCPWCIIGYKALAQAMENVADIVAVDIEWLPFELNPGMPSEGQDLAEHLQQKYGSTEEQASGMREMIKQRGLEVGYRFGERGSRIYNTFDAHRLIHWAKGHGKQTELKLALFDLYFQNAGNPSDHQQLLDVVESVGLAREEAQQVLESDEYKTLVRYIEQQNHQQGISAVPTFIFDNKYLISGGQPVENFEKALRKIAAELG